MKKSTRREFLRYAGIGSAAVVVAACAAPATPAPTPAPAAPPTAVPPAAAATAVPPTAAAAPTAVKAAASGGLPIVKDPLTLSYWTQLDTNPAAVVKSYNEIACYKELEKVTGIHIDFQHVSVPQATEQFNLMIASGKYPDMIETNWLNVPGGPAKAIKDGVIIRLNDLVDKYAPNLKKVLAEHPEWRRQILTDEGDIYCFPFLRGDPYLLTFSGPVVRKDWLDKLNLSMPATVDEWHDMLVAFKTKDPNGNGKADELPYSPWYSEGTRSARSAWYRGFVFGAYGILMEWYQEQGVVKFGALQPQFKDALKTLAQWYKEGLIDPDYVSVDQKGIDAQITGDLLGSTSMNTGGGIGKYSPVLAKKDPKAKLVPAPYPVLKKGDKPLFGQRDNVFPGQGSVAISSACKKTAEAVQWLDYGYGDAGHLLFNFGLEGTSYKMVNGYPTYTDAIMKDPKLPLVSAMSLYIRGHYNGPFVQDKRYIEQYSVLPEQKEAIAIWSQPSNAGRLPPTTPTQAESKKLATIMQDVMTRYEEIFHKVVTGAQPVDAWDQFVKDIKGMGIDDAVKIQQAALDRYNKRA